MLALRTIHKVNTSEKMTTHIANNLRLFQWGETVKQSRESKMLPITNFQKITKFIKTITGKGFRKLE